MYCLTYKSIARRECTDHEIWDLLETSARNNREVGLTGCLIYHKRTFVQVLEGPREQIHELMKKINRDIRHSKVEIISEGPCDQRAFSDWAMGYVDFQAAENPEEVENFEKGILQLSKLYTDASLTVRMFWMNVALLMERSSHTKVAKAGILSKLKSLRKASR